MKKLGIIKSIKLNEFLNHLRNIPRDERIQMYWNPDNCIWGKENSFYKLQFAWRNDDKNSENPFSNSCLTESWMCGNSYTDNWTYKKFIKKINLFVSTNTPIPYVWRNNYVTIANFSGDYVIFLNEFIEIEPLKNVDNVKISEIHRLIAQNETSTNFDALTISDDMSFSDIKSELTIKQTQLQNLMEENRKKVEDFRQEQQRQLDAFKADLLAKENELILMKNKLLDQIFIIEDKIFDLRIIFQEVFDVINVRNGKRCERERPIVVYQKFRYLEDEIVRLSTLRAEYFTGKHVQVEHFIADNEELLNTLCPAEKCVTVCRMTEKDKYYVKNLATDMCEAIETLHGKQLCIIHRDGEHVDIIWVDEDVKLKNNLFLSAGVKDSDADIITEDTALRSKEVKNVLNRKYLLLILQVCINNKIINLPNGENILKQSQYIIYSDADNLLDYDKYPRLDKYVIECNKFENLKVGDTIMIVERSSGSSSTYNGYRREYTHYRGNGDSDRVHDAYVNTGLNKINLLLPKEPGSWDDDKVFVSCEKEWSDKGARANVRVYTNEFINLTWISSNHIKYWIDSKKIGGNFAALNYAQICTFLKDALDAVEKREKEEFALINKFIKFEYNAINIDKLTEWKFNNKVRKIHKMNVKKFINN